ncbi:MAG: hypothetical protein AAF985_15870 [Bacteroidota bacterium]
MSNFSLDDGMGPNKWKMALQHCWPFLLGGFVFFFWTMDHPFFWDTVLLASKQAHFYYDHSFQHLLLPLAIDAGHPPFFGLYLALWWSLFSKTLWISHLAMLPILLGIIWQVYRLCRFIFTDSKSLFWGMLLMLTDATLLAQCSMVSPDLILIFAALLGINSIWYGQKQYLVLATIALSLSSIRGLFTLPALFVWSLLFSYTQTSRLTVLEIGKSVLPFIPVTLVVVLYYTFHFWETGWWISTPNEGWSAHRELTSFSGFVRNIGILAWRLIDFGRIGFWLVLPFLAGLILRRLWQGESKMRLLLALPLLLLCFQAPSLLLIQNPIAHRYLMPVLLCFTLLIVYAIHQKKAWEKWKKGLLWGLLLVQLSGHFWIYPEGVAQGWDASLAHVPYFELRQKMIDYLEEEGIPLESVGTEFPNNVALTYVDLSPSVAAFASKNFAEQTYLFYSNVFNDFSDEELKMLREDWEQVVEFEQNRIKVSLHRKP